MDQQYQLFDVLTPDEFQVLKDDIKERGVLVAVELDENGVIIDGHHRVRAWNELRAEGIELKDYPRIKRTFKDEAHKRNHIRALNIIRRHLNAEQIAKQWADMREDGMTYQAIADVSGVSKQTVQTSVVQNLTTQPAAVTGKDGKQYPPKKKRKPKQPKLPKVTPEAPVKSVYQSPNDVKKEEKKKETAAERKELAEVGNTVVINDRWHIEQGDINTWTTNKQYDFIITDPPYPREYLPLWSVLARHAKEWLKPDGLLIAMSGQSYLNEIYSMLDEHLVYYWTACYLTLHQPTPLRTRQVNTSWKPLLIYGLNDKYSGKTFGDVFKSDQNEKSLHDWEQSESGMKSIIKMICLPGQTILDPFAGAGTTGIAALSHGCLFDGIDIDLENVNISKGRLSEYDKKEI